MDCCWWGRIHLSAIRQCKRYDCFSQSCVCLIDGNDDTDKYSFSFSIHHILPPRILQVLNAFVPQLAATRMLRHCLHRIYRFCIWIDHCTNGRNKTFRYLANRIFKNVQLTSKRNRSNFPHHRIQE